MNEPNIALESNPFLVVADVHAYSKSLDRVLAKAPDVRYKCFLGDAIGYGNDPKGVITRLADFDLGIKGNHDALALGENDKSLFTDTSAVTIETHREMLQRSDLEQLAAYVPNFRRNGFLFFHGTPDDCNEYIMNEIDVKALFERHPDHDVFFAGHMHIPRIAVYDKAKKTIEFPNIDFPYSRHRLDLNQYRYLINAPSVMPGREESKSGAVVFFHNSPTEKVVNFYFI